MGVSPPSTSAAKINRNIIRFKSEGVLFRANFCQDKENTAGNTGVLSMDLTKYWRKFAEKNRGSD